MGTFKRITFAVLFVSVMSLTPERATPRAWAGVSIDGLSIENETWLDRDAVAYFVSKLTAGHPGLMQAVGAAILGARLTQTEGALQVAVYFRDEVWVQTSAEQDAAAGRVYRIEVPKTLRFRIEAREGLVRVVAMGPAKEGIKIKAKIPFLSDLVYVHELSADLSSGELRFIAGIVDDWVSAVAVSSISQPLKGTIDIWGTVLETLPLLKWEALPERQPMPAILKILPGPQLPSLENWKFNENANAP